MIERETLPVPTRQAVKANEARMCGHTGVFLIFFWTLQVWYYLGFEPEVWVRPLPKPEPTKRFGFGYSAEPNPWTSGSKSGSNRVRKIQEPDHGQSIEHA